MGLKAWGIQQISPEAGQPGVRGVWGANGSIRRSALYGARTAENPIWSHMVLRT